MGGVVAVGQVMVSMNFPTEQLLLETVNWQQNNLFKFTRGSVGIEIKEASHPCKLNLLFVSRPYSKSYSPGFPAFLPSQKLASM